MGQLLITYGSSFWGDRSQVTGQSSLYEESRGVASKVGDGKCRLYMYML